ncbi:MAG: DUF1294 domain-containing protein [Oscillospiraceae bacterium]|nr:DUF1294 domain-containing protein [Oscillospiraceae bacterium]
MDKPWLWVLIGYLVIINVIAFTVFGADKAKAKRNAWRVPEKMLFLLALLGGGLGAFLGMRVFHHKTKHWYFQVFIPLILVLEIAAGVLVWLHLSGRL